MGNPGLTPNIHVFTKILGRESRRLKQERGSVRISTHKMRRPGGAVEVRDREIIGALNDTLVDLSGRGRRIIGLFTADPKTLLQSVATQEGMVSTEVWFVNSYPEYLIGTNPHRTSDHGTWHLRETTEIYDKIYNEPVKQIIGYKIKYDYRPRRNGGREQGPNLGLREYTYKSLGLNEHSLCIIYEKRPKRKSNCNGKGVDQVQSEPDHEEAPVLLQMAAAVNPNYAATGPSSAPFGALEVVPVTPPNPNFVVAPPVPAEPAIKSSEEVEEAWDSDDDASKFGWFGFEDMTTYDFGSLDFSEGGCKHNEQSLCIINEKRPKKKPKRNGKGVLQFQSKTEEAQVLQMVAANPNYAATGPSTAAALEGWDFADDFSKNGFGTLDFSDEGWKDSRYDPR